MNRSSLHDLNSKLGARFTDFGGWEMPLDYGSVLTEHRVVRETAGWFDVTHLGRFELTAEGAGRALHRLLSNDLARIFPGSTQYTLLLNEDGGIIDDLVVWWWEEGRYWVFPNAANHQRVMELFASEPDCRVRDLQTETVLIAVQGPEALTILGKLLGEGPRRFRTMEGSWDGEKVMLAGTGYTGERGGELCTDPDTGVRLVRALVDFAAHPCGLGARDTLRLEAGLRLWGSDIDEATTPFEAGLDFAVAMDHEFRGRPALEAQLNEGVKRRLAGFVLEEKGIPRHGYRVRTSGREGTVTSGNLSPILNRGIGMAYLSPPAETGDAIEVEIRDRWVPGRIAEPPFHKGKR